MERDNKGRFVKGSIPKSKGRRKYSSNCLYCEKLVEKSSRKPKFCSKSCSMKYYIQIGKKGFIKGILSSPNPFKKGHTPWNYIDGRSKILGPARYGDDWEAIRFIIYKRDNFTCQECGEKMSKFPFHVHHKIPFLISFDNSPKNLITLCPSCHRKIEAQLIKQIKMEA